MGLGQSVIRWRWFPYAIATAAGLVVIIVAYLTVPERSSAPAAEPTCEVGLTVTSSTEKSLLLADLATEYTKARRPLPSGGCADIHVDGFTSGVAMEALASNWTSAEARAHPIPQVWLPTSTMWPVQLRARTSYHDRDLLTTDMPSIAHSPLVIAMPRGLATALGWPDKQLQWKDVLGNDSSLWARLGHPEWGRFTYAKDDPGRSTSGFSATVAAYYAGAGKTQNLLVEDVARPAVEDFVRQVEANVLYHPPDIMDFLSDLNQASFQNQAQSYVSAVVMQEELAYLHNKGNPKGDPAMFGHAARPALQLVAIHPSEGTIMLDHPYIVLPSANRAQQEAARDFLSFLQEQKQRARFAAHGFRDDRDNAPDGLASSLGFTPDHHPSVMAQPSAAVMEAIGASWRKVSKRANILVVVDKSGSMAAPSGIPNVANRMEAAKAALHSNAKLLNPGDQIGLWEFASDPGNPHPEVLRPSPFEGGTGFASAVDRLQVAQEPYNQTALCVSVRDAHSYLLRNLKATHINAVVVLTDGNDNYPDAAPPCPMDALGDQLIAADPEHQVKVFSIAIGEVDVTLLRAVSAATGARTIDATRNPADIDTAFASIFRSVSTGSTVSTASTGT